MIIETARLIPRLFRESDDDELFGFLSRLRDDEPKRNITV